MRYSIQINENGRNKLIILSEKKNVENDFYSPELHEFSHAIHEFSIPHQLPTSI